jgi:hypothetical protein
VPDGEEWETRYVGQLKESFHFATGEVCPESPNAEAVASLAPGDPYPGSVAGPLQDYRFKQQAHRGVILLRKGDRALYAATGSSAKDSIKGVDADRTIVAIESVRRRGFQVSRFVITPCRDAVYFDGGQPRYLLRLEKGYEFAE